MPPGTPFHGLIPPFPIRVDEFASTPELTSVPALYLLSHTHTDHILGLSSKSFASTTICSPDAKEMLLRHETYNERAVKDTDLRDEARASKTFAHLKIRPLLNDGRLDYSASRDLLKTLPLHTPTKIELCNNSTITLTLFDANHCPGAVMFLVEGDQGAVLHTGDFRAEPWFLDYIRRNPFLQPYLAPPNAQDGGQFDEKCPRTPLSKILDSIYLDTASVLSTTVVPAKRCNPGLGLLMALFPHQTTFFINAWTWGYEDILRAVARSFQSQIHVDRYKHTIYSHVEDPFLHSVITLDPSKTRFHACERFNRCPHANGVDVVYINPVTMDKVKWEQYCALTESKLRAAQPVSVLLVPLSRHSPLQELRAFVSLFRPARVVPNTLHPSFHGLDELCIPHLFADCLSSPPSSLSFSADMEKGEMEINEDFNDAAIQNLIGDGADSIARVWADTGRSIDKLAVIEPFLRGKTRDVVRRTLGLPPVPDENFNGDERAVSALKRIRDAQHIQAYRSSGGESDQETGSDDDDAHMRTAKALFGITGMSQIVDLKEKNGCKHLRVGTH
ncbi:hypothetical protein BGW80DRAFT_1183450 [Lactifluus volemus]|nr:hypothetical protein BGW80DRAFT_1183450 [Lactifluus volemus]